jgi:hypothetical protein
MRLPSLYSSYYLVFEKEIGSAPYRLIRVRRLAKTDLIPLPCA